MLTKNRLKYQTNCYYLKKSYNNFKNVNYGYTVFGENYKIQFFLYLKKSSSINKLSFGSFFSIMFSLLGNAGTKAFKALLNGDQHSGRC